MTTHEQHTITGELEITDSRTMKVIARKLTLTASRISWLCKRRYYIGTKIEVLFPATADLEEGRGGGPWSGYSVGWLKNNAVEIREAGSGKVIHTRKDTTRPEGVHPPYCLCHHCRVKKAMEDVEGIQDDVNDIKASVGRIRENQLKLINMFKQQAAMRKEENDRLEAESVVRRAKFFLVSGKEDGK